MRMIKQKERLEDIRFNLIKGIDFIKSDKTKIVRDHGSMGELSINKNVGSDLCYLYNALDELESLINKEKVFRVKIED